MVKVQINVLYIANYYMIMFVQRRKKIYLTHFTNRMR